MIAAVSRHEQLPGWELSARREVLIYGHGPRDRQLVIAARAANGLVVGMSFDADDLTGEGAADFGRSAVDQARARWSQ